MPQRRESSVPFFRINIHRNCRLPCTEAEWNARCSGHLLRRVISRSNTEQWSCLCRSKLQQFISINSVSSPCSSEPTGRGNVGWAPGPRGRTDEWRRRSASALNHGPRKLGRSHGRGHDVYKYYMCCMEGPKVRIVPQNDISPFLPLILEARIGLSPVCKISLTSLMVATRLPRNNECPRQYSMI
jgi:hypothetical protein